MRSFAEFFHTKTDHKNKGVYAYLLGLMQAKRKAKNMERMEEHVKGFSYQSVQQSISDSPWAYRPLMDEVARQADGLLGGGRRVRLAIDDTGVQKKGRHSVGVARQYLGRIGKVDNCQIAVCASLSSGQRSTLVDTRLYLPEQWTDDPERCRKAQVPDDQIVYKSKAQIAMDSVEHLRELGVRFDVVTMDSGYGSQAPFLHQLDATGVMFVAELHCDAHIWPDQPWHHHEPKRLGAKPLKQPRASVESQRVDEYVMAIGELEWQRLKVREGDQGPVEVSYVARRVWVSDGAIEKTWWLLAWENPDEASSPDKHGRRKGPRRHYALSNGAADVDERELVGDAVQRNVIEMNFRDSKSEVGMSDYQVRGWVAWHHHMALVMLALHFTLNEKMHYTAPEGAVAITAGDITFMMERMLPQRGYGSIDPEEVKKMLRVRMHKRTVDQQRRQRKAAGARPAYGPLEIIQV